MKGYRSRGDRRGRPYLCVPVFHAARRGSPWMRLLAILFLLALLSCGQTPTVVPPGPTPAPPPTAEPYPPVEAWPTWTPNPYPIIWPTAVPWTPSPPPTEAPVIVLGAEWAPEAERQVYVSTTVVVAPMGDGPGEVGYYQPPEPETLPSVAWYFTVDVHGNIYILDVVNHRVVQFDSEGHFVRNIPYPGNPAPGYPEIIVTDQEGRVYIYFDGVGVKCYDPEGRLVQEYPVPSWFWHGFIQAMRVDEQGTLWVEGQGSAPDAPIIDGQPYLGVVVPLGNAAEVFSEERQRDGAVPGLMCNTGTYFSYAPLAGSPLYLYNRQGEPIYACPGCAGRFQMDTAGNLYYAPTGIVIKWDPRGRVIASFDTPTGTTLIDESGTVYCFTIFTMDRQRLDTYRVIRWQQR